MRIRRVPILVASTVGLAAAVLVPSSGAAGAPQVLLVGSWHGIAGQYKTIQSAVDAAHAGDWVLVGPGDYKERADYTTHKPAKGEAGWAVDITTPGLHLRGMNRNTVVVDGTKPGTPECSSKRADQDFGSNSAGRSGIVVDKANGVYVENLTACNFLGQGNQIWWNGGDASGKVGMTTYWGNYISGTTTYYSPKDPQATYGIFVSNARGPGSIYQAYGSNMNDAGFYVGACPDCNAVLNHVWSEHNALGYSGTNSGGHLIIENSEWDDNASGIVTNSQNNDDSPSPQDGSCPSGKGPTGTTSCEIWRNNYIHDNNDANVPEAGTAAGGPVGTGAVIAGGRFDTLIHNRVTGNKAWGLLTTPYPDTEIPPSDIGQHCQGGVPNSPAPAQLFGPTGNVPCYFSDWGNEIAHNTFSNNGGYGNPTNGDIADISTVPPENPGAPGNCWHNNTDTAGTLSQWPQTLTKTNGTCGQPGAYPDPAEESVLIAEVACDSQLLFSCAPPPGVPAQYPQTQHVTLKPLPHGLPTMPNPCKGVPANPWCPEKGSSAPPPVSSGHTTGSNGGRGLAATGLPVALPLAGAVLLAAGGLLERRRRRMRQLT